MHESNPLVIAEMALDSLSASGEPSGPAGGGALATLTTPPAGTYKVCLDVTFTGTAPTAADDSNVEIRKGAVEVKRIPTGRAANTQYRGECVISVDGATNISANADAAATVGTIYNASLTATRIR